jgi:hypothetical protein
MPNAVSLLINLCKTIFCRIRTLLCLLPMTDTYQNQLRKRLENLPYSQPPDPWSLVSSTVVGGLMQVGYADGTDDLLVVSSQGRGLFDCKTGQRIARDDDDSFPNSDESEMTAPGIGTHAETIFHLAGLQGGGLAACTRGGWGIHVLQLPWPIHVVFITSHYVDITDNTGFVMKLCNDEPCTFRAAGFSPTGRSFVVATSCELRIYARNLL